MELNEEYQGPWPGKGEELDADPGLLIILADEALIHNCMGLPSLAGVGGPIKVIWYNPSRKV